MVEVGSSYLFDRCARCAGRILRGRPHPVPDYRPHVDPWSERLAELLEMAEATR